MNRLSIPWSVVRTTAPDQLVPAAALKAHARILHTDEDDLIRDLGLAAERALERELGIAFVEQTLVLRLDRFAAWSMDLPYPPLSSVTSIQYIDGNGDTQTLAASLYEVDTFATPGRIQPAYGEAWPVTRNEQNAVTVTYKAGGTDVDNVDETLKLAVKMMVADLYEHRERTAAQALHDLAMYDRLVDNHRSYTEIVYR